MATLSTKVKLSHKLKLGVGRASNRGNILPFATAIFMVISGVLAIRAGYMVFHHSAQITAPQPQVLGAQDNPTPSQLFDDYSVKKGDTVFSIAQQHNMEWTTLATLNNLQAPFKLNAGQTLKIPKQ